MNAIASPALDDALAALRAPALLPRMRARALPDGVATLLRVLSGDAETRRLAAERSGEAPAAILEAAMLYAQQVLFHASSDSYRVLGAQPDAAPGTLKAHHRWLLHWLHPDRQPDAWETVYAERVNRAWQDLRTPERRAAYDAARALHAVAASGAADAPGMARRSAHPLAAARDDAPAWSPRTVRRLPVLVFAALGLFALALLGWQALVSMPQGTPRTLAAVEGEGAPSPDLLQAARAARASQAAARAADALAAPPPAHALAVAEEVPAARIPPSSAISAKIASARVAPPVAPAPRIAPAMPLAAAPAVVAPARKALPPAAPTAAPVVLAASAATEKAPVVHAAAEPRVAAAAAAEVAAPAAAPAPVAVAPAATDALAGAQARELLSRFRGAYVGGDIAQLRNLLASPQTTGRRAHAALLRDYERLFHRTISRRIELREPNWRVSGGNAVLVARYETWIEGRDGAGPLHDEGDIRFDVTREQGELRILRLRYASRKG